MEDNTQVAASAGGGITEKKKQQLLERERVFIEKAKKIHVNPDGSTKYDYSKVQYKSLEEKVTIICLKDEHGEFQQSPGNHLKNKNCPKCGKKTMIEKLRSTKEVFCEKATRVHHTDEGNPLFDYSLVNYVNGETKVQLICPFGHRFEQYPVRLLEGYGCLICAGNRKKTTA